MIRFVAVMELDETNLGDKAVDFLHAIGPELRAEAVAQALRAGLPANLTLVSVEDATTASVTL